MNEKKISVKNLYSIFVICAGLICLGIGSTYAVFTATAQIDDSIVLGSNLSYVDTVIETVQVTVLAGKTVNKTLQITNNTNNTLNYVAWFIDKNYDLEIEFMQGSPRGVLESGATTSIEFSITNNASSSASITIGTSSGVESIVLSSNMKSLDDFE